MDQNQFRMPRTGEGWRHYKGGLYTIIGMAVDDKGDATVVYTEAGWSLVQLPQLYTQPLGRFLQHVDRNGLRLPRFTFDRERDFDESCPFLNPVTSAGFRMVYSVELENKTHVINTCVLSTSVDAAKLECRRRWPNYELKKIKVLQDDDNQRAFTTT